MAVTLFIIPVAFALSPASATCTGGRTSFPLSVTNDTEGAACAPGFYCPHLDPSNRSTWPVMCAVSPKCQVDRLSGSICTKRDDVDIFEPRICKERFFCPTFREQRECPEGHYCVVGTQRPVPCPLLSPCPAGSLRPLPLFPAVLALAVTCLVAAGFVLYHRALRRKLPASASIFDLRSNEVMASLNGSFDGLSQMAAEDVAKSEWVSGTHPRQQDVEDSELTSERASGSGIGTVPVPFTDNTPSPRETPLDGSSPFCVEDVGASTPPLPAAPTVALIGTRRRVNPPSASSSPNGGSPVQQPTRPVPAPIRKSFTFLPPPALKNANNKETVLREGAGPSASGDLGARPSTRQAPMAIDDDYHTPELHSAPGARCVPDGPEHEDSTGGWFVPRSSDAATSPFRLTGSFNSPASVGDVHKSAQRLQRVMSGEIDPGALLRDRVLARHLPSMQTLLDAFNRTRGERAPIQIDATDVTVTMPDGKVLLHGVNGTMQPGKVTAIMGPTGAGKTMFMTTLLGGVDPAWHVGGALKVNGEPVRFGGIRRQIGLATCTTRARCACRRSGPPTSARGSARL